MRIFTVKNTLIIIIVILVGLQFVQPERTNPAEEAPIVVTDDVAAIMQTSCNDCHSNKTVWPWYSKVSPVSWFIADHVNTGRRHLNFSVWENYPEKRKLRKLDEIMEEVKEGEMPLPVYTPLHEGADLTDSEKKTLLTWAQASMDSLKMQNPGMESAEQEDEHEEDH